MFFWILQMTIISIILISSLHYIFLFFKKNLTIPKTKDLVNKPVENYKKMLNLNENENENENTNTNRDEMKSELKEYLKNLVPSKINTEKEVPKTNTNIEETGNYFQNQGQTQYSSY